MGHLESILSRSCPLCANSGHQSLTGRFSLRQELCRILSIGLCLQLFGCFANNYCAPGKVLLPMLTANRLRKVLSYAPATGIFRWKVSASTRAPVGTIAGAKNGRGYRQIRIDGRPYSASRLAWLYMTQTDLAISKPIVVTACMLAPPNRGSLNRLHVDGTCVPVKEPSTASKADICSAAKF